MRGLKILEDIRGSGRPPSEFECEYGPAEHLEERSGKSLASETEKEG